MTIFLWSDAAYLLIRGHTLVLHKVSEHKIFGTPEPKVHSKG